MVGKRQVVVKKREDAEARLGNPKDRRRSRKAYWKKKAKPFLAALRSKYKNEKTRVEYWLQQRELKKLGDTEARRALHFFLYEDPSVKEAVVAHLSAKERRAVEHDRLVQWASTSDRLRSRFPPFPF